jgi:hypothetical protein
MAEKIDWEAAARSKITITAANQKTQTVRDAAQCSASIV